MNKESYQSAGVGRLEAEHDTMLLIDLRKDFDENGIVNFEVNDIAFLFNCIKEIEAPEHINKLQERLESTQEFADKAETAYDTLMVKHIELENVVKDNMYMIETVISLALMGHTGKAITESLEEYKAELERVLGNKDG